VGKPDPNFAPILEQLKAQVPAAVQLVVVPRGIPEHEVQLYFDLCDYVCTLYQGHLGASGALVRATMSRKPLLSGQEGYMGTFVTQEGLGLTVDAYSPEAIADGFTQLIEQPPVVSNDTWRRLSERNSVEKYAQTIWSALLPKPESTH
jgi:glycosyltransferase involved in cell wall biosynthesis